MSPRRIWLAGEAQRCFARVMVDVPEGNMVTSETLRCFARVMVMFLRV